MSSAPASGPLFIGLMSGTSLDAVDGVLLHLTPGTRPQLRHTASIPLPAALRTQLLALNEAGHNELHRATQAAHQLAQCSAQVCHQLLAESGLHARDIVAIGDHGQTVRHCPPLASPPSILDAPTARTDTPYTLQLHQAAWLAEHTGITVVTDFRSRDLAAGGQGAPLVPAFHQALFGHTGVPSLVINIGGMANITAITAEQRVWGMDSGPGNVLLDQWCHQHTGQWFDAQGAWASSGHVHAGLLAQCLQDPYFAQPGIKSTGRDQFHAAWLAQQLAPWQHDATLRPPDVQATLSRLTALTIAQCVTQGDWHGDPPQHAWVCGGGAHNAHLMHQLQDCLGANIRVGTTDEAGFPGAWMEAAAFGWLAQQCLSGVPSNVPSVTGAQGPRVLGAIYPA